MALPLVRGALLALALAGTLPGALHAQQADLLLTNGKVYVGGATGDPATPAFTEVVAVAGDTIVYVGPAAGAPPAAETIDLGGRLVLPGFVDGHVHAAYAGVQAGMCSVEGAADVAAVEAMIAACLAASPPEPGQWFEVVMFGLPGQTIPIATWDRLRADGPLVVWGLDGHTAYVNSAGLKDAGIGPNSEAPAGGSMDVAQGFLADAAMDALYRAMPGDGPVESQRKFYEGTAYAMRTLNALGVTAIREAWASEPQFAAYAKLAGEGRVTVRSEQSVPVDPLGDPVREIGRAAMMRKRFGDVPYMTVNSIKIFADGVIEHPAHTAALLAPYLDPATGQPGASSGELLFDPATIGAFLAEADRQGFDVHTHAIGDYAVRATLDAYQALRATAARDRRLSIAHLELIDPADFPRFATLQVSANFQFLWAFPEPYTIEATLPYIGPERHRWLYPAGSLIAAGAPLAAGSDWPVSSPDPFIAIQRAVLRVNEDEPKGHVFDIATIADPSPYQQGFAGQVFPVLHAEERLPVKAVVDAYTIGSARELRLDGQVGSIAVGKQADLIVLDRNVLEVAATEIAATRVCRTYFAGRLVYAHDAPDEPLGRAPAPGCN